ncbi:S-layer homology domain-containing protein [Paenibacillus cymbidii]|uniref:S-layer homology domain-containing protein n=1 Tax=Paenibacillus cymbidii TaxID=1639034 RepID=UPI001436ADC9|nr:S-layer homology domain-containing protein [Paenibacillus cymbidii]
MKKICLYILMLSIVMQPLAASFRTGTALAAPSGGGSGADSDHPYIILTPEDLSYIRNELNAHYKLGADIDLAGYGEDDGGWLPIGTYVSPFTGTLDGNGYTIRNLKIERPLVDYVGLFGVVAATGKLANIQLVDAQVSGDSIVGGLVGELSGQISNSCAAGTIIGNARQIYDPFFGYILGGGTNIGGLAGRSYQGQITESCASASVNGRLSVGGLTGENFEGTITNSYAIGDVTASQNYAGGLVGMQQGYASSTSNAFATGSVSASAYKGGLIGFNAAGISTLSSVFWDTGTSGTSISDGGTGKSTAMMKQKETFYASGSGWDFTSIWGIREGESNPYLLPFQPSININLLASTPYGAELAVTGTILDFSIGEALTIDFAVKNSLNATVSSTTYHTYASGSDQSIARSISLAGLPSGSYTLHIAAADTYHTAVSAPPQTFFVDADLPIIAFGTNGNDSWAESASTSVTATDSGSGVDGGLLRYAWTTDTSVPAAGWTSFANGATLTKSDADGEWYLHIRAEDMAGNVANLRSNRFRLDNTGPLISIEMTKPDSSLYTDNSWTNRTITVSADASDTNSVTTVTYSLDGGAAWNSYTAPIVLHNGGTYPFVVKAVDQTGNESVHNRTVNIDKTAPVMTLVGPSSLRLTAGGGYTEDGATATDAGGSGVNGPIAVTGTVYTSAPGTYVLRYNVSDLAGNAAAEVTRTVFVDPADSPAASPSGGNVTTPAVMKPFIDQNGIKMDPSAIDTAKPSVTLEVTPKDGVAYISIPAAVLSDLEGSNAEFFIEIKAPYGSYQVPVHIASLIPGLEDLLAANKLQAEDISFKITLSDKSGNKEIREALANGLPNGSIRGAIVDFHIEIINAKTGLSIGPADTFSKALTRMIPMPKDMSVMPEQWGAFRYDESTNKFAFVAANKMQIEGVWYVLIRSYSNSVYLVAENSASFADMQKHWGKSFVELAAVKGLVEGVGGGMYDPDQAVTRAEFTAMLVRALGRGTSNVSVASYDDVQQGAWYVGEIAAAKELGLLGFANGNRFKPDQPLTREEMASMLAAAIGIEKLPLTEDRESLDGYKDIESVGAAFLEDVRLMVMLQIMTGTGDDTFSPKSESTRAQAAVVFIRTLQALGMID